MGRRERGRESRSDSPTVSFSSLHYRTYSFALTGDGSAGQNGELRLERIATIATQTTHGPTE